MGCHVREAAAMVVVQVAFAGVNIFYKLAINDGMDMRIMVAYRCLFATVFLSPIAFFVERKNRPSITWKTLVQAFFCGLFGLSLSQNLYVAGMKLTSATFSSAMANLIPAITFVLAVMFRMESLGIRSISGQAKVVGTLVGISGAMLLTFFKGPEVNLWSTSIHLIKGNHGGGGGSFHEANNGSGQEPGNRAMGSLLAIGSCFSFAIWLILQAKTAKAYPYPYGSTALMCFMGSIQGLIYALSMQRDWAQWRMGFGIRLLAVFYAGIVASGLSLTVLAWCIRRKGPLYASVFNPLMLVIVAILGSLMLDEKLHLGSILGAVLIVMGLYAVLWGKGREVEKGGELASPQLIDAVIVPMPNGSPELVLDKDIEAKGEALRVVLHPPLRVQ